MPPQKLADDLLVGASKIADYTGHTAQQIRYFHHTSQIPTFKLGVHICARKSQLDAALSAPPPRAA